MDCMEGVQLVAKGELLAAKSAILMFTSESKSRFSVFKSL